MARRGRGSIFVSVARVAWVAWVAWVACAGACGHTTRRFPDRLPLWREPEQPFFPAPKARSHEPALVTDLHEGLFPEIDEALALGSSGPARDVNSLDEVPDSAFFENRIGTVSPDDVAHGGEDGPALATDGRLTITGAEPGRLTVIDRNGGTFLLKLDPIGFGGLLSSSDVVAARLLWALGYPVADARLADFAPDSLVVVAADTTAVEQALSRAARTASGRVRAVASRIPDGKPLGPMPWRGVRADDPNDRIPHEDRRELRALSLIYAFLNLSDVDPDHVNDTYLAPGVVRHHFRDLEGALAAGGTGPGVTSWWRDTAMRRGWTDRQGLEGMFYGAAGADYARFLRRMHGRDTTIGSLEASVDPLGFSFLYPLAAFGRLDAGDEAWAARLILKLDDTLIAAAVSAGGHPANDAEALARMLSARRQSAVRVLFAQTSPFGIPVPRRTEVCAPDLGVAHGLPAAQKYEVEGAPYRLDGADVCLTPEEGYSVVRLRRERPEGVPKAREMRVHILRAGADLRIIGIER